LLNSKHRLKQPLFYRHQFRRLFFPNRDRYSGWFWAWPPPCRKYLETLRQITLSIDLSTKNQGIVGPAAGCSWSLMRPYTATAVRIRRTMPAGVAGKAAASRYPAVN